MIRPGRDEEGRGLLQRGAPVIRAHRRKMPVSGREVAGVAGCAMRTVSAFLGALGVSFTARPLLRAWLAVMAIASTSIGRADVFELGPDGSVAVRGGVGAVVWSQHDAVETAADANSVAVELPPAAMTLMEAPEAPAAYQASLAAAARHYDMSPALLAALVWQESRWQPAALSSKGAIGLGQLMPATARALAIDPREPGANLEGAAHYLRQLLDLFDGDVERALAAYNAGPQRVMKEGGIPAIAETRGYVARVIDRLASVTPATLTTSIGATR